MATRGLSLNAALVWSTRFYDRSRVVGAVGAISVTFTMTWMVGCPLQIPK